jgi:dihydroorotase
MQSLTITQPDDWHLHIREGEAMASVLPFTAKQMGRAIIMPNLKQPITNLKLAEKYFKEIISTLSQSSSFQPLMTIYLTNNTTIEDIKTASQSSLIYGAKLYPSGATTNSDKGVSDIKNIYPVLEIMQEVGLPLQIHGEVVTKEVDIFDREKVFIDKTLSKLRKDFPELKIIFEHITTSEAIDFVLANNNIGATITLHHLLANRNDMLVGGVRPHYFCLPILKRQSHQKALIKAATSGNPKFFLGTDSAPHTIQNKETACGCAGIFSAHAAIELYAMVFEQENALDKLEGFASFFGADFYALPHNKNTITLIKETWKIPKTYTMGADTVVPFLADEEITWKIKNV